MSSVDLDNLECAAIILKKPVWELFKEICQQSGINESRMEAFWCAWVSEDFIPQFMDDSLRLIITKTTWT